MRFAAVLLAAFVALPSSASRVGLRGPQVHRRSDDRAAAGRAEAALREAPRLHRRALDRSGPVAQRRLGRGAAQPLPRSRSRGVRPVSVRRRCRATTTRRCRSSARTFIHEQGLLPWRTAEFYGRLQREFESLKRQPPPGYALDNIALYAAVLAHYVADGHVPLHAVVNYDGQLTEQQGLHSRWETELFERNARR